MPVFTIVATLRHTGRGIGRMTINQSVSAAGRYDTFRMDGSNAVDALERLNAWLAVRGATTDVVHYCK